MNRKKIIVISALVFLVAIAITVWVKSQPTEKQKAFADKFSEDMQKASEKNGTNKSLTPRKTLRPSVSNTTE